jgi:hypothetical protein
MKLNLGSGKDVREGFEGVDIKDFGQQFILDLKERWHWEDGTIDEAFSRYLIPCFTKPEITHFFNELYRVLKDGATCQLVIPAWNASGGYGHPHFQTELKEGFFYFLSKEWREANAPEVVELTCDFDPTWGYNMHPSICMKHPTFQQFALSNYCNSALDLIVTVRKKVPIASP